MELGEEIELPLPPLISNMLEQGDEI